MLLDSSGSKKKIPIFIALFVLCISLITSVIITAFIDGFKSELYNISYKSYGDLLLFKENINDTSINFIEINKILKNKATIIPSIQSFGVGNNQGDIFYIRFKVVDINFLFPEISFLSSDLFKQGCSHNLCVLFNKDFDVSIIEKGQRIDILMKNDVSNALVKPNFNKAKKSILNNISVKNIKSIDSDIMHHDVEAYIIGSLANINYFNCLNFYIKDRKNYKSNLDAVRSSVIKYLDKKDAHDRAIIIETKNMFPQFARIIDLEENLSNIIIFIIIFLGSAVIISNVSIIIFSNIVNIALMQSMGISKANLIKVFLLIVLYINFLSIMIANFSCFVLINQFPALKSLLLTRFASFNSLANFMRNIASPIFSLKKTMIIDCIFLSTSLIPLFFIINNVSKQDPTSILMVEQN